MEFYLALMFTFSDIGPRVLYYDYDGPLGMLACSGSRQEFEKDRAETEGMAGAIFNGITARNLGRSPGRTAEVTKFLPIFLHPYARAHEGRPRWRIATGNTRPLRSRMVSSTT